MCILWRDILLFFLVSTVKVFFIFIRNALVKSSINNVFFKANIKMLIIFFFTLSSDWKHQWVCLSATGVAFFFPVNAANPKYTLFFFPIRSSLLLWEKISFLSFFLLTRLETHLVALLKTHIQVHYPVLY